jgi:hypothetical protein
MTLRVARRDDRSWRGVRIVADVAFFGGAFVFFWLCSLFVRYLERM